MDDYTVARPSEALLCSLEADVDAGTEASIQASNAPLEADAHYTATMHHSELE